MRKRVALLTVGLHLALPLFGAAQRGLRGPDPATGLRESAPVATRTVRSLPAGLGFGRRIGYTTDRIRPHRDTLAELGAATRDLVARHTLVPVDELRPENLSGLDLLVVGVLEEPPSEEQMDVVEEYVLGGGHLVYLGENNPNWLPENVAVGGRFGIEYPEEDPFQLVLTDVAPHPVTAGPFGVVTVFDGRANAPRFFGSMSSPGPYGRSLIDFPDGFSALVVIEPRALAPRSGAVIACAEINTFVEGYAEGDNRVLWQNMFAYAPPVTALHFETEDDFETVLQNRQGILSPEEFGRLVSIGGYGPHTYGAAIFDSSPTGPNAGGSDPDLLVDQGNILILQESGQQSVPDFYDDLDDAQLGGTLVFDFHRPVLLHSIDLIDICPGPPAQDVTVTLLDGSNHYRTYFVPGGWTNDLFQDGAPGYGTLDLTTLTPQPGYQATAHARQITIFSPRDVVRLEVGLASSGAVDNIVFDPDPPEEELRIVSCSLGCEDPEGGSITCGQHAIHVNEEFRVTFNQPVDLGTVTFLTFRVSEVGTGVTVPGAYSLDAFDPRTVVFTPQLCFDSDGEPRFGFDAGEAYLLRLPGRQVDPFALAIHSLSGEPNQTQLDCTLSATEGVMDLVPGRPAALITVFPGQPADGASNVSRGTNVTFEFDDVMNPATLLNPLTGESSSIRVESDADGDLSTDLDRAALPGFFTLTIDSSARATVVDFDPQGLLPPSAWILVSTDATIEDLAGEALLNPGSLLFRTAE